MGDSEATDLLAGCGSENAGPLQCEKGIEVISQAPSTLELPSSEAGISSETDKLRGFTECAGLKTGAPGELRRLDDALQRALEHPKYRMTALRFEDTFIEFIQSGEQRMVIDESLSGFGKCIAHRVARLYGLDSLTVLSSENTPTVGVRRTKKCIQMPEVKLRDMHKADRVRHPWAPDVQSQSQPQSSTGCASQPAQSVEVIQQETAAAAAGAAHSNTNEANNSSRYSFAVPRDNSCTPICSVSAILAASTPEAKLLLKTQSAGPPEGAALTAAHPVRMPELTVQQHASAQGRSGFPADAARFLSGSEAATGHMETPAGSPLSRAGAIKAGATNESLGEHVGPGRDSQQNTHPSHEHRTVSREGQTLRKSEHQTAKPHPSASEIGTQPAICSSQQSTVTAPPSQMRSSEGQDKSQLETRDSVPMASGKSVAPFSSVKNEGPQTPGAFTAGFREAGRQKGFGTGRSDVSGGTQQGRGTPQVQDLGQSMPQQEVHGKVMTPGGSQANTGTMSPGLSIAGQKPGSWKGKHLALNRGLICPGSQQREKPALVPRGREHQHMRDWRANQPQARQYRPRTPQGGTEMLVPQSPFSSDPRAAPSHEFLEQQMAQSLSIDPGNHSRSPLAMSEPLYRPHARLSRMGSLSSLPSVISNPIAAPQQPGYMNPMPSHSAGPSAGAHSPYGSFSPSMAIPPGYMLVPAPGAMQGMPMYASPMQPYPIPGHPGYYYMPPSLSPPNQEGPLGLHSAQYGAMWDPHGPPYSYTPRPLQAMGMPLHSHATLPSAMTHSGHFMAPMEAPPPTWPAHIAQQMRHQQQLEEAQVPQGPHQSQFWHGDPQWQAHQRHSSRQQSTVTSASLSRSGNLSSQHSGEPSSCRGHIRKQQPRRSSK